MTSIPAISDLLKAGVHFGHKTSKRHPKMRSFIFGSRNEISIIDLDQTVEKMKPALEFCSSIAQRGGTIIFVGTKRQAQESIKKYALACGMPYVNTRWIGGTITNFAIISKMIKNYLKMKEKEESGEYKKYTKKEQLELTRKIQELERLIGGIQTLTKLPDALFIVDVRKEETPFNEAMKRHIPVVALCDTNTNPENITYPIPANDDAIKSIEIIVAAVSDAVNEGKAKKNMAASVVAQKESQAAVETVPATPDSEDEIQPLPANLLITEEDEK